MGTYFLGIPILSNSNKSMDVTYKYFLQPGKINISADTKNILPSSKYITESRGKVRVKGKGEMQTYWLLKNKTLA